MNWQPNDSLFNVQWHHAAVASPLAWNATTGRQEVKVCHIDSGIRTDHPDLQGRVLKGWNLVPEVQVGGQGGRPEWAGQHSVVHPLLAATNHPCRLDAVLPCPPP